MNEPTPRFTSTMSRLVSRPVMVAAIAAASILPASAANLIVNGDFSGGTGGTFATGSATASNAVPASWTGYATGGGALQVPSGKVNFNGSNQPTGNYIEQSVTTQSDRWYVLDWQQASHGGGDNIGVVVATTLTSGASSTNGSFRGLANPQSLILTAANSTTVRLSDVGASTVSLDTRIDDVSFDLANGQYNVAHLAALSSDTQYSGAWGIEENAVDGRVQDNSNTVFHNNSNNGWFEMDFTANFFNAPITRIEIEARPGYNSRKGDKIDIFSTSGSLLESIDITSDHGNSSYGIDGSWIDVGSILISKSGETLNLAEVRTFANFVDGVAVPEPASNSILFALAGITLLLRRRK